ncbi:futalosine hydrolase [Malonomonas rubra]|uniref:futalosine hydrolase n=1 Tax=Malonomonas rubra TaxID=57040 RepID=UPI0026ED317F|nr:futalosine hydrolase [Malonomonas rubra]
MLLIIAAVPLETALLRQQLHNREVKTFSNYQIFSGTLHEVPLLIAHGGVGQNAMTLQLTRMLIHYTPQAVLLCGCGGSYPGNELKNGDLVLASEEICGDLGVATEDRFIPLEQLDIQQQPILMPAIQQRFPLQSPWTDLARQVLPEALFGPFVTVNCCSGHPALSTELQDRTAGICENMEGAAAAQVCAAFDIPLLELRGISNPTGTRDLLQWNIKLGAEAAQTGMLKILQHWQREQD